MAADARGVAGEIDRSSGVAIYIQLREILRAYISDSCPPGSALPSERELALRL
ncbi:MAG TPA: GntR family transcriptional regulator, partial [Arthrobacter bacterium]|nr:GntR family transcriptional regulator [Arthrobacter sp.]